MALSYQVTFKCKIWHFTTFSCKIVLTPQTLGCWAAPVSAVSSKGLMFTTGPDSSEWPPTIPYQWCGQAYIDHNLTKYGPHHSKVGQFYNPLTQFLEKTVFFSSPFHATITLLKLNCHESRDKNWSWLIKSIATKGKCKFNWQVFLIWIKFYISVWTNWKDVVPPKWTKRWSE